MGGHHIPSVREMITCFIKTRKTYTHISYSIFLLISTLYRRSEQVLWYGTVFQCNAATGIFGGLISYGIANMDGERGLRAWRW